jgi:hypothetical protein
VDERDAALGARGRQPAHRLAVDPHGELRLGLGAIHRRVGGRVDHPAGVQLVEPPRDGRRVGDVELLARRADEIDVGRSAVSQVAPEHPPGAEEQDPHVMARPAARSGARPSAPR